MLACGRVGAVSTRGALCARSSEHVRGRSRGARGRCCPGRGRTHRGCSVWGWLPVKPPGRDRAAWSWKGSLASHRAQGVTSCHLHGSSTQPCTSHGSWGKGLTGKVPKHPKYAPFCLLPTLQFPRAMLPPRALGSLLGLSLAPYQPQGAPSGQPWPCHRQHLGESTQNPFSSAT